MDRQVETLRNVRVLLDVLKKHQTEHQDCQCIKSIVLQIKERRGLVN